MGSQELASNVEAWRRWLDEEWGCNKMIHIRQRREREREQQQNNQLPSVIMEMRIGRMNDAMLGDG